MEGWGYDGVFPGSDDTISGNQIENGISYKQGCCFDFLSAT